MSTTVTLFQYSWDSGLVGSVVSADASATTYSLGCPSGQGTTCFGYRGGIPTVTVVGGPSTAAQTLVVEEGGATVVVTCKLTATAPYGGACARTDRSGGLSFATNFDPAVATEFATFVPVVVTGGLEKLQSAGATGGGTTTGTGTGASTTRTGTGASTPAPTGNRAATLKSLGSVRGYLSLGVGVAVIMSFC